MKFKSIKEFLKPDRRKIGICIILFLFLPAPAIVTLKEGEYMGNFPPPGIFLDFVPIGGLTLFLFYINAYFIADELLFRGGAGYIFNLVRYYWVQYIPVYIIMLYIFSCLIIFAYDKFKGRKK